MNIKPIETVYNGYRFRSRLEARWAVFFDAAGIKYEYEPEGFKLSDGTRYLPDFYLPELETFVEVKPDRDGSVKEMEKVIKFITWGGKIKRVLILANIPSENDYDGGMWHFPVIYWDGINDSPKAGWWFFHDDGERQCLIGKVSKAPYIEPFFIGNGRIFDVRTTEISFKAVTDSVLKKQCIYFIRMRELVSDLRNVEPLVFRCLNKARQARFEHGESP